GRGLGGADHVETVEDDEARASARGGVADAAHERLDDPMPARVVRRVDAVVDDLGALRRGPREGGVGHVTAHPGEARAGLAGRTASHQANPVTAGEELRGELAADLAGAEHGVNRLLMASHAL